MEEKKKEGLPEKILKVMEEREDYVSGQELCDRFGVSRTAVWKAVKALKTKGYLFDAAQNRGYRLLDLPDTVEEKDIKKRLHTKWAGCKVHFFPETGSTNTDAKRYAEAGDPHGTLLITDDQTGGRGRRGHEWASPKGVNIAMSLILKPKFPPEKASMLTLVMGLAVAEGIRDVTGLETAIKWPNDTVIGTKKATGILTEMSAEPDFIQHVVVGIGINVNSEVTDFPEEIRDVVTSLKLETGETVSRSEIVAAVLERFEKHYDTFVKTLDLSGLKDRYEELLVNKDRAVRVLDNTPYEGICRGIDEAGNLLVEKENGETMRVNAGEVSVRGLYGYT